MSKHTETITSTLPQYSSLALDATPTTSRAEQVQHIIEAVASICGISAVNIRVDANAKTGCRLTRSGIGLVANHKLNEDIACRDRYGVRKTITLGEVDIMVACFVATRAQDFLLDDWCRKVDYGEELGERAQRYLQSCIDDMAAYARMIDRIAFARTHFEAYLSRMAEHAMSSESEHIQLMRALRLYIFESHPQVILSPMVTRELGTTDAMNPFVAGIADIIADATLPYQKRHEQAAQLIAKPFARLLKRDERSLRFNETLHLYDQEMSYDASEEALGDEDFMRKEEDSASRVQAALEIVTSNNIDQLIADNNEPKADQMGNVNLSLPSMSEEIGSMTFSDAEISGYESTMIERRSTIERIAEILTDIATPQEQLSVPRYTARHTYTGSRMHPNALIAAAIQLESGQKMAVWQRAHRMIRPQNMQFQGLDIYLLLDVSYSMSGKNAANAAAMAVCLIEGLELAISRIASDPGRDIMDVRTQLIAFGEGWTRLTPLEKIHDQSTKHFTFSQLMNPISEQTLIATALQHVHASAVSNATRDVLCLVVGDGLFADGLQARKCVMGLPKNVYVAHINIGDFTGLPLTANFETIQDPSVLPEKLYSVLRRRLATSDES